MKKYVFYTTDGYTHDAEHVETENCQILEVAFGINKKNAFENLIMKNHYIKIYRYDNIIACEIIGNPIIL